ncbi:ATP-binding protein [Pantoea agglomerans]|uniref:ATP-binding protein n=1 Tax=Enterobacter agglomerans TaxID=549 RepID=UPI00311FD431
MMLLEKVKVTQQYLRSVRIDTDLGRYDSLDGYICNKSAQTVFENIANQVINTEQRAFTLTGPYGSGKSSLAITFLSALMQDKKIRDKAYSRLDKKILPLFNKAFPIDKGWSILAITGKRANIVQEIYNGFKKITKTEIFEKEDISGHTLIEKLKEFSNSSKHDGLILMIDEMGKYLEHSAQNGEDIHFLQDLAETASRSNGKIILVGILHQAFRQYSSKLGSEAQNDWAKVQGRYVDIPLISSSDETVELLSKAIKVDDSYKIPMDDGSAKVISEVIKKRRPSISSQIEYSLKNCWPLHPAMAVILGPASRRHFGQNERSIFGFISSSEPNAFQDFLKSTSIEDAKSYTPERYWDFLRANLEPAILASPDGHRWAQCVEAVERVEASSDRVKISLIKNIAILDFFRNNTGLPASNYVLNSLYKGELQEKIEEAINELKKARIIIYRKYIESWSIFEGSDFDIDEALKNEIKNISSLDFNLLSKLAGIRPVIAKKHYHHTGSLRWMDVSLCTLEEFNKKIKSKINISSDRFGELSILMPERGLSCDSIKKELTKIKGKIPKNIIPGVPSQADKIIECGIELMALYSIADNNHEIVGDSVARRELTARTNILKNSLEEHLKEILRFSTWLIDGSWRSIDNYSSLTSKIADEIFYNTPCLKSELVNRNSLSPNAVKARKDLLHRMLYAEKKENLGLVGWPAERGLHETLLAIPGIHVNLNNKYGMHIPTKADKAILSPLFKFTDKLFFEENKLTSVNELFSAWEKAPFGVKKGIHPVLFLVYILANKDTMALYKDKYFISKITDSDLDELLQDPSRFHVKKVVVDNNKNKILIGFSEIFSRLGLASTGAEPLEIARTLVGMVYGLSEWSKRTSTLSDDTKKLRDLLLRASDPHKLLFIDLPFTFPSEDEEDFLSKIESPIKELLNSYSMLLHNIRSKLLTALEASSENLEELTLRANVVSGISGDFRFDAFSARLKDFKNNNESIESILSLAANKPPRLWSDNDIDIALLEIATWAQKFKQMEVLSAIKNRAPTREAFAFIYDKQGEKTVQASYNIKFSDEKKIETITSKLLEQLKINSVEKGVLLAALAKASLSIINSEDD